MEKTLKSINDYIKKLNDEKEILLPLLEKMGNHLDDELINKKYLDFAVKYKEIEETLDSLNEYKEIYEEIIKIEKKENSGEELKKEVFCKKMIIDGESYIVF